MQEGAEIRLGPCLDDYKPDSSLSVNEKIPYWAGYGHYGKKKSRNCRPELTYARTVNEQAEALKGQYEQALSSAKEESVQIIQDAKT